MRKNFIFIILLTLLLIVCGIGFSAIKLVKIGVVNIEKVFAAYPGIADIQKRLKEERDKYEAEINRKKEEINILETTLTNSNLTEKDKEARLAEIEYKRKELSDFINNINEKLNALREELSTPVYKKIWTVIQRVGIQRGFSIILKQSSDSILYIDKEIDITEEVINKLKAEVELDLRR